MRPYCAPQDEWPLLVIVPASLRLVWAEELEKWLPHLRPSCIHVIEGKEDRVGQVGRHDRGIGAGRSYRSTVGTTRGGGRVAALRLRAFVHPPSCWLTVYAASAAFVQGSLPHVVITSYEMMQRLTCDACKGRGGQQASVVSGTRPPCRDTQNCMASQRWRVLIVDGEQHQAGHRRTTAAACGLVWLAFSKYNTAVVPLACTCPPVQHQPPPTHTSLRREPHTAHLQQATRCAAH